MSRKYTYEEVKDIVEENGYELISDEYVNMKDQLIFKDSDGYFYKTSLSSIVKTKSCSKFYNGNPYTIQNIILWIKINEKQIKLLSETYINAKEKMKWKCMKEECNEVFWANWDKIYNNRGCPFCRGLKVGKSNCLYKTNPDLSKEWHLDKNDDLTPHNVSHGSDKKVWWKCNKCNHEWESTISNRHRGKGCPKCNLSHGERQIEKWLKNNNVDNMLQYIFNDCRNIFPLPFDFYLPKYNLLIEYQGIQHYEPVKHFGGIKKFKKQKFNDNIKREYCKENNIKLLEISYLDFDNIEYILTKEFN